MKRISLLSVLLSASLALPSYGMDQESAASYTASHCKDVLGADKIPIPVPLVVDTSSSPFEGYYLFYCLFGQGEVEEALFAYYLTRFRVALLLGSIQDGWSGELSSMSGSFDSMMGPTANKIARGDLLLFERTLTRVLEWDDVNDQPEASKVEFPEAHRAARENIERSLSRVSALVGEGHTRMPER